MFKNNNDAKEFLKNTSYPTVIKADNLASGKGVYICNNKMRLVSQLRKSLMVNLEKQIACL